MTTATTWKPLSVAIGEALEHREPTTWTYDPKSRTLSIDDEETGHSYDIDLNRCRTCAQVLDWIMQVAGKRSASDRVLAGLVRDLRLLLRPQQTLCSSGIERGPIDQSQILPKGEDHANRP